MGSRSRSASYGKGALYGLLQTRGYRAEAAAGSLRAGLNDHRAEPFSWIPDRRVTARGQQEHYAAGFPDYGLAGSEATWLLSVRGTGPVVRG